MLRAVNITILIITLTLLIISIASPTWTDVPLLFNFRNGLWSFCLFDSDPSRCAKIPENKVTDNLKIVRAFSIISIILTLLSIILLFLPKVNFYFQVSVIVLTIISIIISTFVYSNVANRDITWDPQFRNQIMPFGNPYHFGNAYWAQVTSAVLSLIVLVIVCITNKKSKEILF